MSKLKGAILSVIIVLSAGVCVCAGGFNASIKDILSGAKEEAAVFADSFVITEKSVYDVYMEELLGFYPKAEYFLSREVFEEWIVRERKLINMRRPTILDGAFNPKDRCELTMCETASVLDGVLIAAKMENGEGDAAEHYLTLSKIDGDYYMHLFFIYPKVLEGHGPLALKYFPVMDAYFDTFSLSDGGYEAVSVDINFFKKRFDSGAFKKKLKEAGF